MGDYEIYLNKFLSILRNYKILAKMKNNNDMMIIWNSLNKAVNDKEIMLGAELLFNKHATIRWATIIVLKVGEKYINARSDKIKKYLNENC
tara:strand:+ start:56 stop:328 length:273 start_codon:yes stop_codon:yes gene_type:complete